jgi:phage baseplate assembly protein W
MIKATGPAYPFRIDPSTGGVEWASGVEKVQQNLRLILGTRYGERPMLREFGSRVHSLVHEPNDDVMSDLLRKQAHEALVQWERRVVVTSARVVRREGEATLLLKYVFSDAPVSAEMSIPLG